MSDKVSILLDTDIGSDIDDAVCLAYLLCHPRCELLGITTVTGNVQQRAALAEVLCRTAGQEQIPIHCGRRDVLITGPGQPTVKQYKAIDATHRLDRPENTAVDFMRDTLRSRPGEITLLSIGPLANLALLFAVDPEIPFLCKSIVSMVGHFFSSPNMEWNSTCDPGASAMVFAQPRPEHICIGLDVTLQVKMPADEVRNKFVGEPLSTVCRFAEEWFDHRPELTFHDPLAAAVIFEPSLCTYQKGKVEICDLSHPNQAGRSQFSPEEGQDLVADTVDVPRFFEEFFLKFN